jgi:hypothetical protein
MRATPVTNPSTPKAPMPVPQNVAHDGSRPAPEPGRGNPGRDIRPSPPGQAPLDYDDGAWM